MMKMRWGGSRKSDLYSQLTSIILTSSIHLLPWRCVDLARKGERTRSKQKWLLVPDLVVDGVVEIRSLDLALLMRMRGREHSERRGELRIMVGQVNESIQTDLVRTVQCIMLVDELQVVLEDLEPHLLFPDAVVCFLVLHESCLL
ncbi:hypothetical protein ACFX13_038988 [Malus domestica]